MLIPSEWTPLAEVGKCYIGMFPNTNAKEVDAFYLGQQYLKKYYTYFDVNAVQTGGKNSMLIGTGLRNKEINILQLQYNKSYEGHDHAENDLSQWTYTPNPMTTVDDGENVVTRFIKKNMILFVVCCVILGFLILTLVGLCIYLRRKSNKNRMQNIFKDKMTYYGK